MLRCGVTFDKNVGAALLAAMSRLSRRPEIAAADIGSHSPVPANPSQARRMKKVDWIVGTQHLIFVLA